MAASYSKRRRRDVQPLRPDVANAMQDYLDARQIAPETSNYYLGAAKGVCNWLVQDGRWPSNPLAKLERLNAETDVRRERRILSAEDFSRLVTAARTSADTFRSLAGADRAMLYLLAGNTGLRASELASLTAASFDLSADVPTVNRLRLGHGGQNMQRQLVRNRVALLRLAWARAAGSCGRSVLRPLVFRFFWQAG